MMRWGLVIAVLTVSLGWFLPTWGAKTKDCNTLEERISESCQCPAESRIVGFFTLLKKMVSNSFRIVHRLAPTAEWTDCQTGEVYRVACSESSQTGERERILSENRVEPSSACLELIEEAGEMGCGGRTGKKGEGETEEFSISCGDPTDRKVSSLPLCDDIRRIDG